MERIQLFLRKYFWLLIIFVVALGLRVWNLDQFPYGFHIDEVKAGENAWSILKTGRDDKGNFLPMYYDSFGDFRPTGIFYMIIPSLVIFGKTIMAVRLPAALFGALTVFGVYFLVREIEGKKQNIIPLLAGLLLAINPWHISVSRATSEVVISLFLTTFGLYFLIKTIKNNSYKSAIWSGLFLISSYFFYHSIRALAPLLVLTTIAYFRKVTLKTIMVLVGVVGVTMIMMLSKQAMGRLSQVSIRSDFKVINEIQKMPTEEGHNSVLSARIFHNKIAALGHRLAEEYFSYFGTDFLLKEGVAKPVRYTTPKFGLIGYVEFGLVILGLMAVGIKNGVRLPLLWLVLAPIPAAVTIEDVPNLHRSMLMVIFLVLVEAYGLWLVIELKNKALLVGMILLLAGNFIYYLHLYYVHGNFGLSVYYRDGGMVELVEKINKLKNNYDRVVLTNSPDSPKDWFEFLSERDEKKIVYSKQKCFDATDLVNYKKEHVLFVNAEGCEIGMGGDKIKNLKWIETVYRKDDSKPFTLWERAK